MNTKLITLLGLSFLMAACSEQQTTLDKQTIQIANQQQMSVFGTVSYKEQVKLPKSAVLTVKLQDTSRQDVAAIVIAQQSLALTSNRPWTFNIQYDKKQIKNNHNYTLSVRIEADGQLYFINKSRVAAFDSASPLKIFVSPVIAVEKSAM